MEQRRSWGRSGDGVLALGVRVERKIKVNLIINLPVIARGIPRSSTAGNLRHKPEGTDSSYR